MPLEEVNIHMNWGVLLQFHVSFFPIVIAKDNIPFSFIKSIISSEVCLFYPPLPEKRKTFINSIYNLQKKCT